MKISSEMLFCSSIFLLNHCAPFLKFYSIYFAAHYKTETPKKKTLLNVSLNLLLDERSFMKWMIRTYSDWYFVKQYILCSPKLFEDVL